MELEHNDDKCVQLSIHRQTHVIQPLVTNRNVTIIVALVMQVYFLP